MTSIYAMYKTSDKLEDEGVILDYGSAGKVKVRRAGPGNERFARVFERKFRPYRKQFDRGTLEPEVANRLMYEVVAETVIIGWEGICDEQGEEIKFTVDNAVRLFTELPEWFADLFEAAKDAATFREEEIETDVKN